jgi:hypothetical protein
MGEKIMGEIQQKADPQLPRLIILQLFEPQFPPVNFITDTLGVFSGGDAILGKFHRAFITDKEFAVKFLFQAGYLTA